MVNICTDFNLSNTTFHIRNINKLLPFIYITSSASPASSRFITVIQINKYKKERHAAANPLKSLSKISPPLSSQKGRP